MASTDWENVEVSTPVEVKCYTCNMYDAEGRFIAYYRGTVIVDCGINGVPDIQVFGTDDVRIKGEKFMLEDLIRR